MNEIYVLTDSFYTPISTIKFQILELLEANVKLIEYRNKTQIHDLNLLKELSSLIRSYGAKFIINDDVKLAKTVEASGVHLGREDGDIAQARSFLGKDAIVGVSCYNDVNLAILARDMGASYVAFGSVFPSLTKKEAKICDFDVIKKAKEILDIPVCVIGGINRDNISSIKELNADYIAIVSAAYTPDSITENIKKLNEILGK